MKTSSKHPYDNAYYPNNVYGHAVELLRRNQPSPRDEQSIHLDIGCGFGRIAEAVVRELNTSYVGIDADEAGLESLASRGFETHRIQIGEEERFRADLLTVIGSRRVASVTILDVIEHIRDCNALLSAVSQIAREHKALVVISVPNIAHRDVGLKLAFGRWDYTEAGLLDHTHLHFFTQELFENTLKNAGLHPTEANNVHAAKTEQHFPYGHSALSEHTQLGLTLTQLQRSTGKDFYVFQFVSLCVPGPKVALPLVAADAERPFLSIITRTQGRRLHSLREVFVALAAQSLTDFEVLVLGHRLNLKEQLAVERLVEDNPEWLRLKTRIQIVADGNRTRPLNVGFSLANGNYIAIMDDDDLPFGHWVETFQQLARQYPGQVLRASGVRQNVKTVTVLGKAGICATASPERKYPPTFDFCEHLWENKTPNHTVAFPRSLFHDFGQRFDESLTTTEDWDFIMRAASIAGVACSPLVTSIYRWWDKDQECSRTDHPLEEWELNHQTILRKMDTTLTLFPPGTAARIRKLFCERDAALREKEALRHEYMRRNAILEFVSELRKRRLLVAGLRAQREMQTARLANRALRRKPEPTPRGPQIHRQSEIDERRKAILDSGFFDPRWYRATYPGIVEPDAFSDYMEKSATRNPGPAFDGIWYLKQNPDVQAAAINPLAHFLACGAFEGREARPIYDDEFASLGMHVWDYMQQIEESGLFDEVWYCEAYPDVFEARIDPVVHYVVHGAAELRHPGPRFDAVWYVRHNPGKEAKENPLIHYLRVGKAIGSNIRAAGASY